MTTRRRRGIAIFLTGLLFGTAGAAVAYLGLRLVTGGISISAPALAWWENASPKLLVIIVPVLTLWSAVFGVRRWYLRRNRTEG